MDFFQHPPVVIEDTSSPSPFSDAPLPSYIARHIPLGFNSDDIDALITSIDSSQYRPSDAATSQLPHLPAEILLHILEYVPIEYVLDWRLVCLGFRDAIDGRVLSNCLLRSELIGYIGPRREVLNLLTEEHYEKIFLLRVHFHHLKARLTNHVKVAKQAGPKRSDEYAVFCDEGGWRRELLEPTSSNLPIADIVYERLLLYTVGENPHGTLRWCIKVDHAVQDVTLPVETMNLEQDGFEVDTTDQITVVTFRWKQVLLDFLKTESMMRKRAEKEQDSLFTYSREEDCLRSVRRQRLRSNLDQIDPKQCRTAWAIRHMRPLFGKPCYDKLAYPWNEVEHLEDDALKILMMLRREASMRPTQLACLRQLATDRATMAEELESMNAVLQAWKTNLYNPQPTYMFSLEKLPAVSINPLFWSEATMRLESQRVRKWKTQKHTIEQMRMLLDASNEALEVPEDAFDDLGSQF